MKTDSGSTKSPWMEVPPIPARPKVDRDQRADVCVVGAGMAGLSTAYLLASEGRRVVVIDDGPVAGGETSRTTAHLTHVIDDRYHWIEQVHGEEGARLAAESHTAAIDRIERTVRDEGIECAFERVDGYLFVRPGDPTDELKRELAAARRAGIAGAIWVEEAPLPSFRTGRCLRFPSQAQFHPLRYLTGVAAAIERRGGRIHGGTKAVSIEDGAPARVRTDAGAVIEADAVVVATNTPVHMRIGIHPKLAPYRTYVLGAVVPRGAVPRALYYDTGWPYHYVRLHEPDGGAGHEILIVGGEDHKTGQEDDPAARWSTLESWARERFPEMREVRYRWSGQVFETMDGLAFIGRDGDHRFLAAGDSGMGMTHGTIASMLLADLIAGRSNPWERLYSPSRVSLRAAGELARENANFVAQYVDYVTSGDVGSVEEIAPGEGAVIRRGLTKIAVYRDPGGALHARSAVCPHLGCIVAWNAVEKTWDCPCHGSRFDARGKVVTGPSLGDLGEATLPEGDGDGRVRRDRSPEPAPPWVTPSSPSARTSGPERTRPGATPE